MAFRRLSLSPVSWLTTEKLTQQILWLVLFAVLAPILGPRPYGLFSIVMVFVGFCEYVMIDGAAEALLTVDELDHLHTTTTNLATGIAALALSVLIVLLAPLLASLFHDDALTHLTWALAPLPLFSAMSAAPIAVMRRSLQYKRLAIRSIAGLTIGGVFGIGLALAGAGVWALVLQVLAQRLAEVAIAWMSVPIRLGFRFSAPHFREIAQIGVNIFAARMMNFASGQLPRIIIGYVLGPTELGLFTLASRFLDIVVFTTVLPRTMVGRVELRTLKAGSPQFTGSVSAMMRDVAVLSFPALLGLATLTPALFRLWLDQRWAAGVTSTQYLLLSGLAVAVFYCIDAALLGAKLSSMVKRTAALQALTTIATVACAAPFGLEMTCLSLALRPFGLLPFLVLLFRRTCRMNSYGFLLSPARALAGSIGMAMLLNLPMPAPLFLNPGLGIGLSALSGVIIYYVLLASFARADITAALAGIVAPRTPNLTAKPISQDALPTNDVLEKPHV